MITMDQTSGLVKSYDRSPNYRQAAGGAREAVATNGAGTSFG